MGAPECLCGFSRGVVRRLRCSRGLGVCCWFRLILGVGFLWGVGSRDVFFMGVSAVDIGVCMMRVFDGLRAGVLICLDV